MQHPPDHLRVSEGAGPARFGTVACHLAGGIMLRSRSQQRGVLPHCVPPAASVMLAFLAALMVLLPVNYRAETDRAHPQSPFQVWIDTVTGRSHHQDDAAPASLTSADAPAAASPLLVKRPPAGDTGPPQGDASVSERLDAAEATHLHVPMSPGVIIALGIATMVVAVADQGRLPSQRERRRAGVPRRVDPPPPRLAPC